MQLRVKHFNELSTNCYLPYADSSHLTKPPNQLFLIPPVYFNVDLLTANHCKSSETAPKPFLDCPCRIRSTPAPALPALSPFFHQQLAQINFFSHSGIFCKCRNQIIFMYFIYIYMHIIGLGFFLPEVYLRAY